MREVIQSIKLIIIEVPPFRVKLKYGVRQNNFDLKVFTRSLGLRPETFDYGKRKNCTSQIHYTACLGDNDEIVKQIPPLFTNMPPCAGPLSLKIKVF